MNGYLVIEKVMFQSFSPYNTLHIKLDKINTISNGMINELKVSIVNENGIAIDNHGVSISVVLKIVKDHEHLCRKWDCHY